MAAGVGHEKFTNKITVPRNFRPSADCLQETLVFLKKNFKNWDMVNRIVWPKS